MTREDHKKAAKAIFRLDQIESALKDIEVVREAIVEFPESSIVSLSEWGDGSGWNINLNDTIPPKEFVGVIEEMLTCKLNRLEKELAVL